MSSPPVFVCLTSGESYPAHEPRWRSESGGLLDLQGMPDFHPDAMLTFAAP